MPTLHSQITGADNHEPKGVESAPANTVYRSDGLGSGSWGLVDATNVSFNDPSGIITSNDVSSALLELAGSPITGGNIPLSTDNRTLVRFRRKQGLVKVATPGAKLRIAMTGDSWSNRTDIPDAIISLLSSKFATTQYSGISPQPAFQWTGLSQTFSGGWTWDDASTPGQVFDYGTGPDGHTYHTGGAAETITITGAAGTGFKIYTRNYSGTWRYRVDGGAYTVVNDTSGGALKITTISGLTDGNHTIDIDTTGNTGRVSYCGIINIRSAGVELVKLGNAGITAARVASYLPLAIDAWTDVAPDLVIYNLGTNDYRTSGQTPSLYLSSIQTITSIFRGISPDISIIFVVPPQSNGTIVYPLSDYRDATYQHALATGCEMVNLYDSWGPYNSDLWVDTLHVNPAGASIIAHQINEHLWGF